MSYAGDVDPTEAWKMLTESEQATLVDVRSQAEWSFVGVPELSGAGKRPLFIEWQTFPAKSQNPDFVAALAAAQPDKDAPMLFLCRSGGRSRAAAMAMTAAGYRRCYNVADGFEGNPDAAQHRGQVAGWKAVRLPWIQE
jgi:rhodanese-related sulfurtransferase